MRRLTPILAAILLSAGLAYAQVGGSPGITGPVTNPTFTGIIDASGGVFKGATPLCFEGSSVDGFETCFAITDPTASDKTITFPNLTGTVLLGGVANSFAAATTSITFTGATNATPLLSLEDDDTTQDFLTFTDVGTAGNVITFQQDVNTPSLALNVATAADSVLYGQSVAGAGAPLVVTTLNAGATPYLWVLDPTGAAYTAGATLEVTPLHLGLDTAVDQIRITPFADAGTDFTLIITSVDITGADKTATFPNGSGTVALDGQFNHAIADSGGAGAAVYNYEPEPGHSVATFDCLDADGCSLNVGEANAYPGQRLVIIQTAATSGTVTVLNNAGVVNLDAAGNQALTVDGTIELVYFASTWQQISLFYDGT